MIDESALVICLEPTDNTLQLGCLGNINAKVVFEGDRAVGVEIVTGVNLPVVLKCASLQRSGKPLAEIAHMARDRGQRSICVASDLLADERAAGLTRAAEETPS